MVTRSDGEKGPSPEASPQISLELKGAGLTLYCRNLVARASVPADCATRRAMEARATRTEQSREVLSRLPCISAEI